jgi:hypothetical protein
MYIALLLTVFFGDVVYCYFIKYATVTSKKNENKVIDEIIETKVGYKLFSKKVLVFIVPLTSTLVKNCIIDMGDKDSTEVMFKMPPSGVNSYKFLIKKDTLSNLLKTSILVED